MVATADPDDIQRPGVVVVVGFDLPRAVAALQHTGGWSQIATLNGVSGASSCLEPVGIAILACAFRLGELRAPLFAVAPFLVIGDVAGATVGKRMAPARWPGACPEV